MNADRINWTMWIDLEGFSTQFRLNESRACGHLIELMYDLKKLGEESYPNVHERLFIHQAGDGFVMCSDSVDQDLSKPVAIAIALLRSTLARFGCLKVGIGEGKIADYTWGYFPDAIKERERIGEGIMTVWPIMGDGLIDAHEVSQCASGPLLLVKKELENGLSNVAVSKLSLKNCIEIDWLGSELSKADELLKVINPAACHLNLNEILSNYIKENEKLPDTWKKSALLLLRGYPS